MRIAVDARKLADYGIGSYIRGLVTAMATARPDHRFVLLGNPEADSREWPDNVEWLPERSRKYGLTELLSLARRCRDARADLFHAPHYVYPLRLPCPGVVTIHDCIHLRFPDQLPRPLGFLPRALSRRYALMMMRHAGRAASAVITVSRASASDLAQLVGVPTDRTHVVYNGCDSMFRRPPIDAELAAADRIAPPFPFALFVGNDKPHKNLSGLLGAIRTLDSNPPLRLAIVGGADAPRDDHRVHALGRVDAPALRGLMARARMLVLPSLFEGFGLPALEAMAAGLPVIAARAGALPEVVAEAGILVPPDDEKALADALARLRDDDALHARLGALGVERAGGFGWQRAALGTLEIYERAAGDRSG